MDELVNPFVIKRPNRCLVCDSKLLTIGANITIQEIDEYGHPSIVVSESDTGYVYCPICHEKYGLILDERDLTIKLGVYKDNREIVYIDSSGEQNQYATSNKNPSPFDINS